MFICRCVTESQNLQVHAGATFSRTHQDRVVPSRNQAKHAADTCDLAHRLIHGVVVEQHLYLRSSSQIWDDLGSRMQVPAQSVPTSLFRKLGNRHFSPQARHFLASELVSIWNDRQCAQYVDCHWCTSDVLNVSYPQSLKFLVTTATQRAARDNKCRFRLCVGGSRMMGTKVIG